MSIPIELCQRILGCTVFRFCRFHQPFQRLLWITSAVFQPLFSQGILSMDISKPCRLLPVFLRQCIILFCPGSCMEHPAQTVLQLIIMALFFQGGKPDEGIFKRFFCPLGVFLRTYSIPKHLRQFIGCIRIPLFGRHLIKPPGLFKVLLYTLPTVIQTAQGILGILVFLRSRFRKPLRSSFIICFRTKTGCVHFSNSIPQIREFPLFRRLLRSEECPVSLS